MLSVRKRKDLIAPWIAVVVGIHFIPLASILQVPVLFLAGVLVTLAGWASVRIAKSRGLTISFVTGVLTGSSLLLCGVISLVQALTF